MRVGLLVAGRLGVVEVVGYEDHAEPLVSRLRVTA